MAGLLARLFGKRETRRALFDGVAIGDVGSGFYHHHGRTVTAPQAEALGAVAACVSLICNSAAALPAQLVIDTPSGRAPAPPTASAWRLLRRPNPWMSWPILASWITAQLLLWGNALLRIDADQRGAPMGLTPVPWWWVIPRIVTSGATARLVYDITFHAAAEAQLLNLPARLLDNETLHIRNRPDIGIIGRSVLSRASSPVHEGLQIAEAAIALWKNGLRPSGVLKVPTYLSDNQRKRKAEWVDEFTGAVNTGKVPLLEGGWAFDRMQLSSVDAEFLASRKHSVAEICRLFNVPEALVQPEQRIADPGPFVAEFAQFCLAPLCNVIEAEVDASVLQPGQHLMIDLGGLMRGNYSAAVAASVALVQAGVISANEIRQQFGYPAHPDGDGLRVGAPPSYPADFKDGEHLGPSPGPSKGVPEMPSHSNQGSKGNGAMPMMQ
jgi:HK97 family phage portal protein